MLLQIGRELKIIFKIAEKYKAITKIVKLTYTKINKNCWEIATP